MTRLPPLTETELNDDQRHVWENISDTRRGLNLVGPDGGLVGPFNAMVHAPHIGEHQSRLGHQLRSNTSIEPHLLEVAICTVGAYWRSEFEFWAHRRLALESGVDRDVIEAIRTGTAPPFPDDDRGRGQRLVHSFTSQLLTTGAVEQSIFEPTRRLLGQTGIVELTALIGYYCMISLTLNAFDVPLPDGEAAVWSD